MRKIFTVLVLILGSFSFGQEIYRLDSISWSFQKPENYQYSGNGTELFSFKKDSIESVNSIEAIYTTDQNLNSLKPEVFAYYVKDSFDRIFNSEALSAETSLEIQFIDQKKFFVIRSFVNAKDEDYNFIYKYYYTEINNKLLAIVISYDNDDDKKLIEDSLFNSKFIK